MIAIFVDVKWGIIGFINGEYDPVDRFIVMSRKLIDVLLASIVMRRLLFAKILHIFFLMSSICRAVLYGK